MNTATAEARPIRADAEVVSNAPESSRGQASGVRLVLRTEHWPGFEPGQFVMLSPGALAAVERSDPLLPRPMAVYRTQAGAARTELEILYQVTGRGTALLAEARPGDRVRIVGPLGTPFPPPAGPAVLVGGGTGIASLYELARRAAPGSTPEGMLRVMLGARSSGGLMGLSDFEGLPVELSIATEDGSVGERGLVTAPLERALTQGGVHAVYACGPTPMMARCAELAARHSVRCLVSLENNMACGFGVCLGCATPRTGEGYALVCRDGPVFDAAQVDWAALA